MCPSPPPASAGVLASPAVDCSAKKLLKKKGKGCKAARCAYDAKAKPCAAEPPLDACLGLKKRACKKRGGCEWTKKKACAVPPPVVCDGLSKKKCKKVKGCTFKRKECKVE